jgi:hypothetical protein
MAALVVIEKVEIAAAKAHAKNPKKCIRSINWPTFQDCGGMLTAIEPDLSVRRSKSVET